MRKTRLQPLSADEQSIFQSPLYLHKAGWNILNVSPDLKAGTKGIGDTVVYYENSNKQRLGPNRE